MILLTEDEALKQMTATPLSSKPIEDYIRERRRTKDIRNFFEKTMLEVDKALEIRDNLSPLAIRTMHEIELYDLNKDGTGDWYYCAEECCYIDRETDDIALEGFLMYPLDNDNSEV